jgi:hypothetical protein
MDTQGKSVNVMVMLLIHVHVAMCQVGHRLYIHVYVTSYYIYKDQGVKLNLILIVPSGKMQI